MENVLIELIEKQSEYITLLGDELDEVVPIAWVNGYRSQNFEAGKKLRDEIAKLNYQLIDLNK